MEYGYNYFLKNKTVLELEAQEILLRFGKEHGWSFEEIGKIQEAKNNWMTIYQKEQNAR